MYGSDNGLGDDITVIRPAGMSDREWNRLANIMQSRAADFYRKQGLPITDVTPATLSGFNIGKMFGRMFHFTPKSFTIKNITGALGSAVGAVVTGGLGPILAPKQFGAHGSVSKIIGSLGVAPVVSAISPKTFGLSQSEANIVRGITAAAAVAVAPALMPALSSTLTSAGSLLSKVGSLASLGSKFLPFLSKQNPQTQAQIVQTTTPEQVAAIDQGQLDPNALLQAYSGGTGASIAPSDMAPPDFGDQQAVPVQASMGFSSNTMLLLAGIGLSILVPLLSDRGRR